MQKRGTQTKSTVLFQAKRLALFTKRLSQIVNKQLHVVKSMLCTALSLWYQHLQLNCIFFNYRVCIWADLTKTARKQQIWDVARVAARFCLLYDDERWSLKRETKQAGEDEVGCIEEERNNEGRSSSGGGSAKKSEGQSKRSTYVTEEAKYSMEKDLLRILAEVHFINAEV